MKILPALSVLWINSCGGRRVACESIPGVAAGTAVSTENYTDRIQFTAEDPPLAAASKLRAGLRSTQRIGQNVQNFQNPKFGPICEFCLNIGFSPEAGALPGKARAIEVNRPYPERPLDEVVALLD